LCLVDNVRRGMDLPQTLSSALEALEVSNARCAHLEGEVSALGQLAVEHGAVVSERAELTAKVIQLSEQNAELSARVSALTTERETLENKANARAADVIASLGVPPANVQPATAAQDNTPSLRERIAATSDPLERAKLRAQLLN